MEVNSLFCAGRYKVATVSSEMRMSHWIDAPIVARVEDNSKVLDLSNDLWDLEFIEEEGDTLLLVLRKYPGQIYGVKVRILPEDDRFSIADSIVTREQLLAKLAEFA